MGCRSSPKSGLSLGTRCGSRAFFFLGEGPVTSQQQPERRDKAPKDISGGGVGSTVFAFIKVVGPSIFPRRADLRRNRGHWSFPVPHIWRDCCAAMLWGHGGELSCCDLLPCHECCGVRLASPEQSSGVGGRRSSCSYLQQAQCVSCET